MKRNHKALALLGLFLLSAAAGFAAGPKQAVLNFWYWDQNGEEVYKQLIAEFEKANPNIKINMAITPWSSYWTKLQTALPSGSGPDVFWLNHPNAVTYIPTGLLRSLEPSAAKIGFDNFDKGFYEPYAKDGKRYGVPLFYDSIVLFYNKALFDKAGLKYPTAAWTWKEYFEAAQKLTVKSGGKTVQYGTLVDSDPQSGAPNFIYQNGGEIFSKDRMKCVIDSPESREAVQAQLDLMYKYGYAPTIQEVRESNAANMFQTGLVAMMPDISANLKQYAEVLGKDLGVAPMAKQKRSASVYHNLAYVASAKTRYPEEADTFLAFLASKRHAELLAKVWTPCFKGGTEIYFKEYGWLDCRYISEAMTYGHPLPISGKNAGQVYRILTNELGKIYMNAQVGGSLAELERTINAEIAK
ncbi:MAG TPA: sugar ABC transporter substrate-binding protein [Spirochaetia bacterium]|nr:sugar ABC transporter substrate-binding protein [Spirochaetia bacterium]